MISCSDVLGFKKIKRELENNGLFLNMDAAEDFIVGDKKYKNNWFSLLEKLEHEAPIFTTKSLEEARAFAIGLVLGKNKKWKY